MSKRKYTDLSGRVFGSWTVVEEEQSPDKNHKWLCVCVCGEVQAVRQDSLLRGKSKQCKQCSLKGVSFQRAKKIEPVPAVEEKSGLKEYLPKTSSEENGIDYYPPSTPECPNPPPGYPRRMTERELKQWPTYDAKKQAYLIKHATEALSKKAVEPTPLPANIMTLLAKIKSERPREE